MDAQGQWDLKSLREFWQKDGLKNITPDAEAWPEGFDPRPILRKYQGEGSVTELGCGPGRLCQAFDADKYLGVDINFSAVDIAQKLHPDYKFATIDEPYALPGGDLLLAYTVFLHMPDNLLRDWVRVIRDKYERVLICEILGREWRKLAGDVPVFNRSLNDYNGLMYPMGIKSRERKTYKRYDTPYYRNRVQDVRIHFLEYFA